jgi:hypothetical protein
MISKKDNGKVLRLCTSGFNFDHLSHTTDLVSIRLAEKSLVMFCGSTKNYIAFCGILSPKER